MYHKISLACSKAGKAFLVVTVITITFLASSVNAQKRYDSGLTYGGGGGGGDYGWGLSLTGGYDAPLGVLGSTFKGGPTIAIGYLRNYGDFTLSSNIGYLSYKPKLDTFYNDISDHTQGYIQYGNFVAIQVYVGAAYNVQIANGAKLYFGLDLGNYWEILNYTTNDGAGDGGNYQNVAEQGYIAPKIGVNFMLNDNLSLGVQAKYNFLLSSSSGSGDTYDYGYNTIVNKSYSGNIVLTYNF